MYQVSASLADGLDDRLKPQGNRLLMNFKKNSSFAHGSVVKCADAESAFEAVGRGCLELLTRVFLFLVPLSAAAAPSDLLLND